MKTNRAFGRPIFSGTFLGDPQVVEQHDLAAPGAISQRNTLHLTIPEQVPIPPYIENGALSAG